MPRISVLLPVYNAERYLREAIQSIVAQSYGDFELIVMDDGSTDGSHRILEESAREEPRMIVLQGEHKGLVKWLNEGLRIARGEFIARMDADDISHLDRFLQQVEFLERNPDGVAVGGQAIRIDADGDPIDHYRVPLEHCSIDARHLRGEGGMLIHPAVMMRAQALREGGGYNPDFEPAEDLDLFLRLAEIGRVANLPAFVLSYRIHFRNVSQMRAQAQRERAAAARVAAHQRRGLPLTGDGMRHIILTNQAQDHLARFWARAAFRAGNYRTARKHARRALLENPLSGEAWWVAGGAVLGKTAKRLWNWRTVRGEFQK